jgi:hypothetical protein
MGHLNQNVVSGGLGVLPDEILCVRTHCSPLGFHEQEKQCSLEGNPGDGSGSHFEDQVLNTCSLADDYIAKAPASQLGKWLFL